MDDVLSAAVAAHMNTWRKYDTDFNDDTFEHRGRVHDWRNHVSSEVQGIWATLTLRERQLIWLSALEAADNEEWD